MFAVSKAILSYPVATGLDAVVTDWVSRVAAAGGSVASSTQTAVDNYVKGCKTDGYWSTLESGLILPHCTDGFAGLFVPLVIPSGGTLTPLNFVSSDYSLATGLNPGSNNTTRRIDTNMGINTLFTSNSAHISAYNLAVVTAGTQQLLRAVASNNNGISVEYTTTVRRVYGFSMGTSPANHSSTSIGFASFRIAAGVRNVFRNGVSQISLVTNGAYPSTENPLIALYSNYGTGNFYRNRDAYFYAGLQLSSTNETLHYNRVQALQTALGRAV